MIDDLRWTDAIQQRWDRVSTWMRDDSALARRFLAQLAEQTGWHRTDCERGLEEYRRFALLASLREGRVVPSVGVDKVWHLHLTYTRDYWQEFCPHRLQLDLHHQPALGGEGEAEDLHRRYIETLHAYDALFGPPAEDWWPNRSTEPMRRRGFRVGLDRRWRWAQRVPILFGLLLLPGAVWALSDNPLDWTGPQFLALYVFLIAASLVGSIIVRVWMKRQLTPRASHLGEPGVWSIAHLSGGPGRVADAAVAELNQQGVLSWDATQRRLRIEGEAELSDPVLRTAATAIRHNADLSLKTCQNSQAFAQVRQDLLRRGWWFSNEDALRIARAAALLPALVCAFGIAKIAIGISRDKPVMFLVVLTILAAVIAAAQYFARSQRTPVGDAALRDLNRRHATQKRAPRGEQIALAVALAGTGILAGTALAGYHEARYPSGTAGSDSGGGGGDSSCSSSDSSGGSSCSSGCGGCGGGD